MIKMPPLKTLLFVPLFHLFLGGLLYGENPPPKSIASGSVEEEDSALQAENAEAESLLKKAESAFKDGDFKASAKLSKDAYKRHASYELRIRAKKILIRAIHADEKYPDGKIENFRKPIPLGSPETRAALYEKYRLVSNGISSNVTQGKHLDRQGLRDFYAQSGSKEAALVFDDAWKYKIGARSLFWAGFGVGMITGIVGVASANSNSNKSDSSGLSSLGPAIVGVALGAGLGAGLGTITASFKMHYANREARKAADIFNKHLQKELELDLGIIEGNASGKLTLSF